jgi:FkbM family methyltransferase
MDYERARGSAASVSYKPIGQMVGELRNAVLRHAASILVKSGTFRRHLGTFDRDLDPDFLRAVSLIRGASDREAIFVRDLVNATAAAPSNADQHQDLWVLHETQRKTGGFFVEFGATDGLAGSNTLLLERKFGWRGILAEPNPVWHADLKRNRTAAVDHRCVFRRTGEHVKFAATEAAALATIDDFRTSDGHANSRANHCIMDVETVSLNDLLACHSAPRTIDYMSIDTEGSELAILEQFDFTRWDVRLFSVEHNLTAQEQAIDRLMAKHGYERRYASYSTIDGWYRKGS